MLEWSARQQQVARTEPSPSPFDAGSTSLTISSLGGEASAVKLDVLEAGAVRHKGMRDTASLVPHPPTPPHLTTQQDSMKHSFELELLSGTIYCKFQLATYYYQPIAKEEGREEEEEKEEEEEEVGKEPERKVQEP